MLLADDVVLPRSEDELRAAAVVVADRVQQQAQRRRHTHRLN
jgi:hypothetical protein